VGVGEGGDVDVVGAEAVGYLTQIIHIRFNSSRPQINRHQISIDCLRQLTLPSPFHGRLR